MAIVEGKRLVRVSTTKACTTASGAYAAEDVVSEATASATTWGFDAIAKVNGGTGYIVKAQALCETTNVTPRLTLYLFNGTPTCELDDNASNTALVHADLAIYVGKIDFPAMEDLGNGDSEAIASPGTFGNLPLAFNCSASDDALYGVLVTRDAFTNTSGNDVAVALVAEQY